MPRADKLMPYVKLEYLQWNSTFWPGSEWSKAETSCRVRLLPLRMDYILRNPLYWTSKTHETLESLSQIYKARTKVRC